MAQLNDTPGVVVVEIDLKGVAQRRAAMPLR
jgi:predicted amidohydrolase